MKFNAKRTVLAAAVAGTCALGMAGQASAYVYGAAGLTVDGLTVTFDPFQSVSITNFQFTLSNTATLNGAGVISGATCGGLPGPGNNDCTQTLGSMDADAVNSTGSAPLRTNNDLNGGEFEFYGVQATNYSNSDSWIVTAELVNLGQPSKTHNIAESLLATGTGSGTASSQSSIESITGLTISFDIVGGPASFSLDFLADPDIFAAIFGEPLGTYGAQAAITWTARLEQNLRTDGGTLQQAAWSPQGTAANDCTVVGGLVCAEAADTQDLNVTLGTTANNTSSPSSWDPNAINATAFGIDVTGLTAGSWTLTLFESKTNQLNRRIVQTPEPGLLGLMGLGLAGLAFSRRRRSV
jgi:hypothetical protein